MASLVFQIFLLWVVISFFTKELQCFPNSQRTKIMTTALSCFEQDNDVFVTMELLLFETLCWFRHKLIFAVKFNEIFNPTAINVVITKLHETFTQMSTMNQFFAILSFVVLHIQPYWKILSPPAPPHKNPLSLIVHPAGRQRGWKCTPHPQKRGWV